MLFSVAAVAAGVDADGGEFAALAPAFDSEGRDAKDLSNFAHGEEVWEVVEIEIFFVFVFGHNLEAGS